MMYQATRRMHSFVVLATFLALCCTSTLAATHTVSTYADVVRILELPLNGSSVEGIILQVEVEILVIAPIQIASGQNVTIQGGGTGTLRANESLAQDAMLFTSAGSMLHLEGITLTGTTGNGVLNEGTLRMLDTTVSEFTDSAIINRQSGDIPFIDHCEFHNIGRGAVRNSARIGTIADTKFLNNNKGLNAIGLGGAISTTSSEGIEEIINCTFHNNFARSAGAIGIVGSIVKTISSSIFESNQGGGIAVSGGGEIEFVQNCTFLSNTGSSGGGIQVNNGKVDFVADSTFELNKATNMGGAIFIKGSSSFGLITGSEFISNEAGDGGAITVDSNAVLESVTNSNFKGNKADGTGYDGGGAIYVYQGSLNEVHNCIFEDNTSFFSGGAICLFTQAVPFDFFGNSVPRVIKSKVNQITNSTFIGNVAIENRGGAISLQLSQVSIMENLHFANNRATVGGAVSLFQSSIVNRVSYAIFDGHEVTENGGALYLDDESTIQLVADTTFARNRAGKFGGALSVVGPSSLQTIRNCNFTFNSAETLPAGVLLDSFGGGAITNSGDIDTIQNSVFVMNTAQSGGGAIRTVASLTSFASLGEISNCQFVDNSALTGPGGALYLTGNTFDKTTSILSSSFVGNVAKSVEGSTKLTDAKDVLGSGGAIFAFGPKLLIDDCNFQNCQSELGGALFLYDQVELIVKNTNLTNNVAVQGGALYVSGTSTSAFQTCGFHNNSGTGVCAKSKDTANNVRCLDGVGGAVYIESGVTSFHQCSFSGSSLPSIPLESNRFIVATTTGRSPSSSWYELDVAGVDIFTRQGFKVTDSNFDTADWVPNRSGTPPSVAHHLAITDCTDKLLAPCDPNAVCTREATGFLRPVRSTAALAPFSFSRACTCLDAFAPQKSFPTTSPNYGTLGAYDAGGCVRRTPEILLVRINETMMFKVNETNPSSVLLQLQWNWEPSVWGSEWNGAPLPLSFNIHYSSSAFGESVSLQQVSFEDTLVEHLANGTQHETSVVVDLNKSTAFKLSANFGSQHEFPSRLSHVLPPNQGGSTTSTTGSTEVFHYCSRGQYKSTRPDGTITCTPCEPGTFSPEASDSSVCTPCPAGRAQPMAGKGYCEVCLKGTVASEPGSALCSKCPPGFFGPTDEAKSCVPCTGREYQGSAGKSSCAICPAGYRIQSEERTLCLPCGQGKYSTGDTGVSSSPFTCQPCVAPKTLTTSESATSPLECVPPPGWAKKTDESAFQCPVGLECSELGVVLNRTRCTPGFWRPVRESLDIRECQEGHCEPIGIETVEQGSRLLQGISQFQNDEVVRDPWQVTEFCSPGRVGPLCAVCQANYSSENGECLHCLDDPSRTAGELFHVHQIRVIVLSTFVVVTYMLSTFGYIYFKSRIVKSDDESKKKFVPVETEKGVVMMEQKSTKSKSTKSMNRSSRPLRGPMRKLAKLYNFIRPYKTNIGTKVKILIGLFQVLSAFGSIFKTIMPRNYGKVFGDGQSIVDLDIFSIFDIGCYQPVTQLAKLWFFALVPPAMILLVVIEALVVSTYLRKGYREAKISAIKISLLILLLFYPVTSRTILETFTCETFMGSNTESYRALRVDYSVNCDEVEYIYMLVFATVLAIIYPIGVLVLFAILLFRLRIAFRKPTSQRSTRGMTHRVTTFVYTSYSDAMYWYEEVEMVRKLVLTSLLVIVVDSTEFQVQLALLLCVGFLLVVVLVAPYRDSGNNKLAVVSALQLVLFCFFVLTYQYFEEEAKEQFDRDVAGKTAEEVSVLRDRFSANQESREMVSSAVLVSVSLLSLLVAIAQVFAIFVRGNQSNENSSDKLVDLDTGEEQEEEGSGDFVLQEGNMQQDAVLADEVTLEEANPVLSTRDMDDVVVTNQDDTKQIVNV